MTPLGPQSEGGLDTSETIEIKREKLTTEFGMGGKGPLEHHLHEIEGIIRSKRADQGGGATLHKGDDHLHYLVDRNLHTVILDHHESLVTSGAETDILHEHIYADRTRIRTRVREQIWFQHSRPSVILCIRIDELNALLETPEAILNAHFNNLPNEALMRDPQRR
jgi:hypothetical protein